jgi:hypothetical protein
MYRWIMFIKWCCFSNRDSFTSNKMDGRLYMIKWKGEIVFSPCIPLGGSGDFPFPREDSNRFPAECKSEVLLLELT